MASSGSEHAFEPDAGTGSDPQLPNGKIKFPKSSTRKLREWFLLHPDNPYPTEDEKERLQEVTGLTVRQISRWFVNARRRGSAIPKNDSLESLASASASASVPIPVTGISSYMSPLDRWRHSPPDQEAAPISAIAQAVAHSLNEPGDNSPAGGGGLLYSGPAHSVSSTGHSGSLASSDSSLSGSSAYSYGSASSFGSKIRRRRQRRSSSGRASSPRASRLKAKKARLYQCTFCTDTFTSKYDWTRHESTLHLALEIWTCAPYGAIYDKEREGSRHCAFCDEINPDKSHLQSHNFDECHNRPLPSRKFYRKDHLRQHLRHVHSVHDVLKSMTNWKSKITQVNSRCGFCGEWFSLWSDRNDHLAEHFQNGASMKDWTGDRGLEANIAILVENAIPPYLIGTESLGMEPFSATKNVSQYRDSRIGNGSTATLFETLTAHLSELVTSSQGKGIVFTDELLRQEARIFVYGDDDSWNQTPADNFQWLGMFKRAHGLDSAVPITEKSHGSASKISPKIPVTFESPSSMTNNEANVAQQLSFPLSIDPVSLLHGKSSDSSQTHIPWVFHSPEVLEACAQKPLVPWVFETPERLPQLNDASGVALDTASIFPPNIESWNFQTPAYSSQPHSVNGFLPIAGPSNAPNGQPWKFQSPECLLEDKKSGGCMRPKELNNSSTAQYSVLQTPDYLSQSKEKGRLSSSRSSTIPPYQKTCGFQTPECLALCGENGICNSIVSSNDGAPIKRESRSCSATCTPPPVDELSNVDFTLDAAGNSPTSSNYCPGPQPL